ncbi:hypothetical protein KZX46_02090 (plasmid) [Polymorphobacter sp. PAMC 29334]|uniref:hypothetical protein n=1 Tax=Polymorphobacter sp. PAMC 29334 TaxID=2862331 RepID=UPI001C7802F2|nr:hypothetical protein [Polymorphobacter sp. PAMC 29334]QYE32963.1 hypothetical protein KZX46_02090 [Polymorphobacter sp. PAMC 29334]
MDTMLGILGSVQLMGGNGAMRDDQRAWLANRRKCGADPICLKRTYDRRVGELMTGYQTYAKAVR